MCAMHWRHLAGDISDMTGCLSLTNPNVTADEEFERAAQGLRKVPSSWAMLPRVLLARVASIEIQAKRGGLEAT